jgi:hypothetical protein
MKVVSGALRRLRLNGEPLVQVKSSLKIDCKRISEVTKIQGKVILKPLKQQLAIDLGRPKQLTGVVMRDLQGVRSIILAFFLGDWHGRKNKPVATDYYYIPEGGSQFRWRFKPIVPVKVVQVLFCDVAPGFLLPKVELF